MTDDRSANLSMPLLMPAQAQKHVTHNEALLVLDALVQLTVEDRSLPLAPADPVADQRHIVPAGAGALWGGPDHAVAVFDGIAWQFHPPRPGWRAYVLAEAAELVWQDGAWQGPETRALAAPRLGVNAAADAVNRLAVASEAVLLNHDGAGHRLKINKAGPAETASLLFQTGFSGRAEMGTAGGENFTLKMSADGSLWTEALRAEAATGRLVAPQGLVLNGALTGLAVTQGDADTGAGRVLKVGDYGLGRNIAGRTAPSNDLNNATTSGWWDFDSATLHRPAGWNNGVVEVASRGTNRVVQIACRAQGQTEPGAVIRVQYGAADWSPWRPLVPESGSNANGSYTRFADGTMECFQTITVSQAIDTAFRGGYRNTGQSWTFPAAFSATPCVTGCAGSLNSFGVVTHGATATAVSVCHTAVAAQASAPLTAQMRAVGRWF